MPIIFDTQSLMRIEWNIIISKLHFSCSEPAHTSHLSLYGKMDVQLFFFMFIVAENSGSENI